MTPRHEEFILRIADTNLVAAQRLGELIGHAPEIEQDISLTNIGLDHLERARALYQYLADLRGDGITEDTFAFERKAEAFRNLCLAELPNTDYAHLILRQFLLDSWHLKLLARCVDSTHPLLSQHWESWLDQTRYHHKYTSAWVRRLGDGTAARGSLVSWQHWESWLDQTRYHHKYTSAWVRRLGDGTEESHRRMQEALLVIWPFGREIVESDAIEQEMEAEGIARLDGLGAEWLEVATQQLESVGLELPQLKSESSIPMGKQGCHTPHLTELLEEMQFMHRQYPNLSW